MLFSGPATLDRMISMGLGVFWDVSSLKIQKVLPIRKSSVETFIKLTAFANNARPFVFNVFIQEFYQ